jgi:hypothetical protein
VYEEAIARAELQSQRKKNNDNNNNNNNNNTSVGMPTLN